MGEITRDENSTSTTISDDRFSWNGSFLIPTAVGTDASGDPLTNGLAYIQYQPQNTDYSRIRKFTKSEVVGNHHNDLSFWRVWSKDGTVYTYNETMMYIYDWVNYGASYHASHKWFLTSIKNLSGQEIIFKYKKTTVGRSGPDGIYSSNDDIEVQLHEIYYANNRYYIHFATEPRPDYVDVCREYYSFCITDQTRLKMVEIYYNPNGSIGDGVNLPNGALITRKYELEYYSESDTTQYLYPVMYWHHNDQSNSHTSTLKSIREFGRDGGGLPKTTFTYGDRMHLTAVNNGYNGKVELIYETMPWPAEGASIENYGYNIARQGYPDDLMDNPPQYKEWNYFLLPHITSGVAYYMVPPGKVVWMEIQETSKDQQDNTKFIIYYGAYDAYHVESGTITAPSQYKSALLYIPNSSHLYEHDINLRFGCLNHCHVSSARIGLAVTRYRVVEKRIYQHTSSSAYDSYTYSYTDSNGNDTASVNTPSLSNITPSDYVVDKVFHRPYSEFRGHGTVKVTNPDGAYTITHYYQTDSLAGQVIDAALYEANGHKVTETIHHYTDVMVLQSISSPPPGVTLPSCKNASPCKDANIYWTGLDWTESRAYDSGSGYIATKTEYTYRRDGSNKPIYGLLKHIYNSEKNGGNWDIRSKEFFTYIANYGFINDSQYVVGLRLTDLVCSANGSDSNPAWSLYRFCGENPADYYQADAFVYETSGRLKQKWWALYFVGSTTTNDWSDHVMAFQEYHYDAYGNANQIDEGYREAGASSPFIYGKSSYFCYGTYAATPANPTCNNDGMGVYLAYEKNPLGQVTRYEYDKRLGVPTKMIDPNQAETNAGYDQYARLVKVVKPADTENSPTLQFSYLDSLGSSDRFSTTATQKISSTQSNTARKYYNGLGELIQTQQVDVVLNDNACSTDGDTNPDTCTVVVDQKTEYLSGVRRSLQTAPYAVATPSGYVSPTWQNITETVNDSLGRPVKIKAPGQSDNTSQRYAYSVEASARLAKTTATDPKGNQTETWADAWGNTVKVRPAAGPLAKYTYDIANRLTAVEQKDRASEVTFATTSMAYDVAGRKTGMTDPDMGNWTYSYDVYNNLIRQKDAKNQRICLLYDALNRVTDKGYRAADDNCAMMNPLATYSYDGGSYGKGRRTGMTDASGSTAWVYDARGRVTSETKTVTGAGSFTTGWAYNSADLVAQMTYPSGEVVATTYHPQMTVDGVSGTSTYVASSVYDAAGRVVSRSMAGSAETFTYYPWNSSLGLLSGHQVGSLMNLSYTYDGNGNILSITNPNDTPARNFTYDALDRLSSATVNPNGGQAQTITYSYDAQGRLTTKAEGGTLVYNSSSPFRAVKSASDGSAYGYDANGNMTARSNVGGKNYTLTYDPENRLTGVSGDANASYVYDGDGNRVLGTVNGVTTVYIGNYYEVRLPNSPVSYYYAGGQRVAQRSGSGPAQYIFSDHLGSTALVTDGSLNLISEIRYNPWGGVRAAIGTPAAGNAFTYTGQRQEADLGLMFYNARWYDPLLGRFVQADSIIPGSGNPLAWDRYAYINNNPVNGTDPTGHCPLCFIGGAIGGLIGAVGYFVNNYRTFDSGEYWAAVGVGITAGALVGSGVGIMAAPEATAAAAATANAMIGAGSAATITEADYLITNPDSFNTKEFAETTAISAAVGGVSAALPMNSVGVAAKGLTYITGSETQYALQTDNWTVQGAQQAVIYGTIGAAVDVGFSSMMNSTFRINGQNSQNAWPGYPPSGYSIYDPILIQAAKDRGATAAANAAGDILSSSGTAVSSDLLRKYLLK